MLKNKYISLGAIISIVLLVSACFPLPVATQSTTDQVNTAPLVQNKNLPQVDLSQNESLLVNLYQQINPGVVAIRVTTTAGESGQGSGFVYDQQGHIVTNYHVVEEAESIEVDFANGYRAEGEVIGTDLDSDIAVIKVDAPASELFPLPLGNSSQLQVGQTLIAIGNPFGLSGSMTVGIVSALGRTMESMREAPGGGYFSSSDQIQTDAAMNPGNSGGPLLNLNGEVIGINRAIRTDSETILGTAVNSGIGFAVPIDTVKRVIPDLISKGSHDYPYLGITSRDEMTLESLKTLGMPANTLGAYVIAVSEGGPADQAGLRGSDGIGNVTQLQPGGDWIIGIDGQTINRFSDLLSYLVTYTNPGDTVTLTILRDGKQLNIPVILTKRPD
jgi:S1-C subfamily serine protease